MSTLRVDNLNTLSGNGIAADIASVSGAQLSNRNKVHNGDMRISQRYGTTAHTPSNTFEKIGNKSLRENAFNANRILTFVSVFN